MLMQPVSVQAQLLLGVTIIIAMLVLWTFFSSISIARQLFIAFGSFVVMRYVYWRATSTLPPLSDPIGFGFGFTLLMAELYCFLILAISLIVNADPLKRPPMPVDPDNELPTVDVFVPSYNEDEYILATTIAAAKSMDYPPDKLTVWLLDDGGTDQKCNDSNPEKAVAALARRLSLQKLCSELGAQYLTRAKNEHAKAGNMNNGLKHSNGEVIVVFDADHAPFREFLRETIGHFKRDPKLFLVQTPHVFLNPDPIERNLQTWERMPSENEMFYSVTQRGLDKWNGSFFCGSAALLRRAALETTGGFSGITITEDCETAFELHAKGWTSVFVDKPLIAGLQPETFSSFIGQRSRWCQGMFQILMLKNPSLKLGLNFIQRIAYLSSMTFWFFPLPRLIFMFAPLIYIFFDTKIFVSNVDEAIAYTSTYIVVNMLLQNFLYGRVRWPWISELYEYVQGVYLSKAIFSVVLSPRKPTFNVTAKGLSLDKDHLSELAWPYFAIYALLMFGGCVAFYRYMFEPGVTNLMLIVGLWNTFNLIIAGAALGVVSERRAVDRHPRLGIERSAALSANGRVVPVIVINVSTGGCGIRPVEGALPGDITKGRLHIVPLGNRVTDESLPVVLRHAQSPETNYYGFEFDGITNREYNALADLMYGEASALQRFLDHRRSHKNLFAGTFQMLIWGVTEPIRAFSLLIRGKTAQSIVDAPKETSTAEQKVDKTVDATLDPLQTITQRLRQEKADAAAAAAASGIPEPRSA
ncbi:UDP-forming cellulose synthase catalytic subunit [Variibacter gotjawalensis]|nr:UDP-forming cellulose synthase catalytic subunit [Variibacter gotjawalensis]